MKKLVLAAIALTAAVSVFAQGSINLNNRVGGATGANQTTHVWGPAPGANNTLSLIGLGSNDSPVGTTPFAANGMALIGSGGATGAFGYRTTYATLIGALGSNVPEASLLPLNDNQFTTFRSGSSLGDVALLTVTVGTLNGPWQDASVGTFEMVAWDNSSGLYSNWQLASAAWIGGLIAAGHSNPVNITALGGTANLAPNITQGVQLQSFNLYYLIPEPSSFALAGLGLATLLVFRRKK